MQNLCTKVSQLCCLFEIQLMYGICLIHDTWVIVVHAVDVSPNLYLVRHHCSTYQRSCIVRTATLQVINLIVSILTYEALCDINLIALMSAHHSVKILLDKWHIRLRVLVSTHKCKSIKKYCLHTLLIEVVCHHVGAHHLTLGYDNLLLERGEGILGEGTQIIELLTKKFRCLLLRLFLRIEFFHVTHIFLLKLVDDLLSSFWVFLVKIVTNLNQRICSS